MLHRARSSKAAPARHRFVPWLCAALLLLVGLTRTLVLCTHADGDTHVEFAHEEGACCVDPLAPLPAPTDDDDDTCDSDPTCSHVDLLVDVGPEPRPDTSELPQEPVFAPLAADEPTLGASQPRSAWLPPPTGPPRPRRFLAQHATVRLLL